jgi:hypothetical protein
MRLKSRSERRPHLPKEDLFSFYSNFLQATISHNLGWIRIAWRMLQVKRRIERDPERYSYTDQALTPVREDDEELYELFSAPAGAKAAIEHLKKVAALTH